MKKTDLLIGFILGIGVALLGTFLFLMSFTEYKSLSDIQIIKQEGLLGKIVTLGAILNIVMFFLLLKINKELMARGIVLATIILALLTVFL